MDDILKNIFGGGFGSGAGRSSHSSYSDFETASTMEASIAEGSTVETSVVDSREVLEVSIERMALIQEQR